ncbi:MAG: hypothetical protein KDK62_01290 [Chlamydiia bacterium]|nr:hypothetical protein [Chlamydiia bacterium]
MSTNLSAEWGRSARPSWVSIAGCGAILFFTPPMVFYFYMAAFHFQGSLIEPLYHVANWGSLLPPFSWQSLGILAGWIAFQIALYKLPNGLKGFGYRGGILKGAVTPAGNELDYRINGLQAWAISVLAFVLGSWGLGLFSADVIFNHWGPILWGANAIGFVLAIFAYVKAYAFPSHPEDRKFSGSKLYDFFMGIELNPRVGDLDLKLFFNGRPGIIGWTLINLSFAGAQWAKYGMVTNSMILVNVLQGLYVVYFFWKEAWYLKTIDIHHDHFGWMLAWGDAVWLPYMYTLQGLYLVFNPVQLSNEYAIFVLWLGLVGFYLFLDANNQKDRFKQLGDKAVIWGKAPKYLTCSYTTKDHSKRESRLLLSGWWGVSRHMNYTGDLILSLCYSLACGFEGLFPYFYFVFLFILLVHRCLRDEERCQAKYGSAWTEYTRKVKYRLIPGVW